MNVVSNEKVSCECGLKLIGLKFRGLRWSGLRWSGLKWIGLNCLQTRNYRRKKLFLLTLNCKDFAVALTYHVFHVNG